MSELESAGKRNFFVFFQSKPGLKPELKQTFMVKAVSPVKAKQEALKLVQVGPFKYRTENNWIIFVDEGKETNE